MPRGSSCCCSTVPTMREPAQAIAARPRAESHLRLLARVRRAASARASSTATASPDRIDPPTGLRFDPRKAAASIPTRLAVANTENYDRAQAAAPGDNTAAAMKSVVVDPHAIRLGGRHAARTAVRRLGDLRAARRRLHAESQFRRRAGETRHLRRPDRENSVPASTLASGPSS